MSDHPVDLGLESFIKALADPTRLRILMLLRWRAELCVCDLQSVLSLSQPKISRHLKILRDEAVVSHRRERTWIHYRINARLPPWAVQALDAVAQGAEGRGPFDQDRRALEAAEPGVSCGSMQSH